MPQQTELLFLIVYFRKNEDAIGKTCGMQRGEQNTYWGLVEKPGRGYLENQI
jgi:hypothetical protein